MNRLQHGKVIGKKSPDFTLFSTQSKELTLSQLLLTSPVMLAFYPGGTVKPVCNGQFCDYRDNYEQFKEFNLNIIGISSEDIKKQEEFAKMNSYPFTFLTDPGNKVSKLFNVKSVFIPNTSMRAIFIIGQDMTILYRYVEATFLTRRGSKELVTVLKELRELSLI